MAQPRVSIVIPSFQNAAYIERTMESVLAQTFTEFELVVADHQSSDGTWELLQQYAGDDRVRLMQTPTGGGAPANWERVTAQARAPYLKLVPGDDVLYPTCVEQQVRALDQHPSAVVASVRRDLIDPADGVLLKGRGHGRLHGVVPGEQAIRELVRSGANLLGEPGCVMIRTAVLRQVGGWTSAYPFLIDQVTYMKALRYGDLLAQDTVAAAFRVSSTQWSVRLAREQAGQAHAAHRYFRQTVPSAVSRGDELIGNARATGTAWLRRLAYAVWRRRISISSAQQGLSERVH
jgi:glycosyltransferase involved in cell wall biosynthesis